MCLSSAVPLPKPTPADVAAARGKRLRDVLAPGLTVVFCGINPGLYSGATGHHFARPGNRFWTALHRSGWTDRLLDPSEDRTLPRYGIGITNLAPRTTAAASQLTTEELRAGARRLVAKLRRYRPKAAAFLGIEAYRTAFGIAGAGLGRQPEGVGDTQIWVFPNPSGLNAHYRPQDFADLFRGLRLALTEPG